MRCEIVRDAPSLSALRAPWSGLWRASPIRAATLHPAWVLSWWDTLGGQAASDGGTPGELFVVTAWHGRDLIGLAPLFLAAPRGGAVRTRELRLVGDALVGVGELILAAPGEEGRVRDVVVEALAGESSWDLLDVTLATRPPVSRLLGSTPLGGGDAEGLSLRFAAMGRHVERIEARGRAAVDLVSPWERFVEQRRLAVAEAGEGGGPALATWNGGELDAPALSEALGRLLAANPATGLPADAALRAFVARALPPLCDAGVASVGLLPGRGAEGPGGMAVVVADGDRRMELLRVARDAGAADRLALSALRRAVDEGAARYEFAADSPLAAGRAPGVRLRVFSRAAASVLERGYATLMRRAVSVADSAVARVRGPIDTIRGLREAGPAAVTAAAVTAVGRVATFARLHLYRGELFVWGGGPAPTLPSTLRLMTLAEFDALAPEARARFALRLELDAGYARQKWERGDLVVVALHGDEPAGILWCARGPVFVPEIAREVKPAAHECYIHDVFVAPDARGHAVAPAMLDFVARELRERDVYRAWALIERTNTASTRAFEKAAYAAFADVIYARMGTTSRLLVRPPDTEAKRFLDLARP